MSQLLLIKRKLMERLLIRMGFNKLYQKGNHAYYKHDDGRVTTLPCQHGRKLAPSLVKEILREIEIDIDQFNELVSSI